MHLDKQIVRHSLQDNCSNDKHFLLPLTCVVAMLAALVQLCTYEEGSPFVIMTVKAHLIVSVKSMETTQSNSRS